MPCPTPRINSDEGSVTIEAALALSSLVIVTSLLIAGIATMAAHLAAIDTAHAAARAHAIGVNYQPPRGQVSTEESAGLITVTAEIPSPLGTRRAEAIFPVEEP